MKTILEQIIESIESRELSGFSKDLRYTLIKEQKDQKRNDVVDFIKWAQSTPTASQFYSTSPELLYRYYLEQTENLAR
jgi:hypothetical protein